MTPAMKGKAFNPLPVHATRIQHKHCHQWFAKLLSDVS